MRAWVADPAERERFETELHGLVGHSVKEVRYAELRYDNQREPAWRGPVFDSIDFGLELRLETGARWSFSWRQEDINIGLLAGPGALAPDARPIDTFNAVIWDATAHWHELGPSAVSAITPVWTRHGVGPAVNSAGEQVAEARESDLCLMTVILTANSGREAVITLGERGADGGYDKWGANNVAVFFSVADARDSGVLLPGDAVACK